MTNDIGDAVRARRERLHMNVSELSRATASTGDRPVSRETIAAIEAGKGFRHDSLTRIEQALQEIERESGFMTLPLVDTSNDMVTVEVRLADGKTVRVTVDQTAGVGRAAAELEAVLARNPAWTRSVKPNGDVP